MEEIYMDQDTFLGNCGQINSVFSVLVAVFQKFSQTINVSIRSSNTQ